MQKHYWEFHVMCQKTKDDEEILGSSELSYRDFHYGNHKQNAFRCLFGGYEHNEAQDNLLNYLLDIGIRVVTIGRGRSISYREQELLY